MVRMVLVCKRQERKMVALWDDAASIRSAFLLVVLLMIVMLSAGTFPFIKGISKIWESHSPE